jgi:hypothetical protein
VHIGARTSNSTGNIRSWEQLNTGVEAMRSLAESDSWDKSLNVEMSSPSRASTGSAHGPLRSPR